MIKLKISPGDVRGFNYHPSYSHDALEDWLLFDEDIWRKELTNGKNKFPKMNTARRLITRERAMQTSLVSSMPSNTAQGYLPTR